MRRERSGQDGYRLLLAALLARAFEAALGGPDPAEWMERDAARRWILADPDDGPFSYTWTCSMLGLRPDRGRAWLLARLARERPRKRAQTALESTIGGRADVWGAVGRLISAPARDFP